MIDLRYVWVMSPLCLILVCWMSHYHTIQIGVRVRSQLDGILNRFLLWIGFFNIDSASSTIIRASC